MQLRINILLYSVHSWIQASQIFSEFISFLFVFLNAATATNISATNVLFNFSVIGFIRCTICSSYYKKGFYQMLFHYITLLSNVPSISFFNF